MLNLKEDTFFYISHKYLMNKIWIKLETISSLSYSMELSMKETFLINDYAFSGLLTLKDNYDSTKKCLKQPELPYIYQPMFIFSSKVVFLLLGLMRSIPSFRCSCFLCLQAFLPFHAAFTRILCHSQDC